MRSNAASICSSEVTSRGIVKREPTEAASGSTRSLRRSFAYEKASSAPSRCIACAIPQAIERSVATPTMSARLPARKAMLMIPLRQTTWREDSTAYSALRDDADEQSLARAHGRLRQAVPALDLRDGHLEDPCDAGQCVPVANGVGELAGMRCTARGPTAAGARDGQSQVLAGAQRLTRLQTVHQSQGVHIDAMAPRVRPQGVSASHHDPQVRTQDPTVVRVHERRGTQHLGR